MSKKIYMSVVNVGKGRSSLYKVVIVSCFIACILALLQLFYEGFCAFTCEKFALFDYGVYTNTIWNSLHGHFFRCLVNRSYLTTHLSFSLVLLSPIYLIWDHPFVLWVVQWLFLVVGVVFLVVSGRRYRIQVFFIASLSFFYIVYQFTQYTILLGFHGVSLFFVLVPLLYYVLSFEKRFLPIVLLIIFGVREEAALMVVPILLYFGWRDSWKWGYIYALLSLAYSMIAIFGLYPLMNGMSIFRRRGMSLGNSVIYHFFSGGVWEVRFRSFLWLCLPILPFLRKKAWLPVVVFPSICILQALLSGKYQQYSLSLHYAATIMAFLVVGLFEAARILYEKKDRRTLNWIAGYLLVIALFSNAYKGFLPGFRVAPVPICYRKIHIRGLQALRVASHLPKKGLLLCHYTLAGFCANRAKIISYREYDHDPSKYKVEVIFGKVYTGSYLRDAYLKFLSSQDFGVIYFDGFFFIMKRAAPHVANRFLEAALKNKQPKEEILFTHTLSSKEHNVENVDYKIPVLHWKGGVSVAPKTFYCSRPTLLKTGRYVAIFLFSVRPPKDPTSLWGAFMISNIDEHKVLRNVLIEPIASGFSMLRSQKLFFTLDKSSNIQVCVTGCQAPLWLDRVMFIPLDNSIK